MSPSLKKYEIIINKQCKLQIFIGIGCKIKKCMKFRSCQVFPLPNSNLNRKLQHRVAFSTSAQTLTVFSDQC